jgi:hypothetical protein
MGKGNPGGQHQAGVIGQTQVTFHNVHTWLVPVCVDDLIE